MPGGAIAPGQDDIRIKRQIMELDFATDQVPLPNLTAAVTRTGSINATS
jgi:hypothetical protein